MKIDGMKKQERLLVIIGLFEKAGCRYRTREIADKLGINEDTASKYLQELSGSGILPIRKDGHVWILPESSRVPHLELSLSHPEAVSLYLAGRLLSQTQDEQNWHVTMALKKLVEALPPILKERQQPLLDALLFFEHPENQLRDMSNTFQALASGWATQRRVRLSYEPPHRKSFECFFDPYLLEPSAIGRTIYAIGYSSLVKDIRTYKLERIQRAELTPETFTVSEKFKGPEMLQQAWGVMYGDEEPIEVCLRFSSNVTSRVRETRWHPSQKIALTRTGCEWTAIIGDTLEIEPWIRSWGSDCEVLKPAALRDSVLHHALRMVKNYGYTLPKAQNPEEFDDDLFRTKE